MLRRLRGGKTKRDKEFGEVVTNRYDYKIGHDGVVVSPSKGELEVRRKNAWAVVHTCDVNFRADVSLLLFVCLFVLLCSLRDHYILHCVVR